VLSSLGLLILVGSLAIAGIVQGRDLGSAGVSFAAIASDTRFWLVAATLGQLLLLAGSLLLAVNFCRTVFLERCGALKEALAS
jgi:cbb3-type cytochrome oxidase subunit 1